MSNLGTHADEAVVTDTEGTISSYLRGMVTLLAQLVASGISIAVDSAVELKDHTADTRAAVKTASAAADTDPAVVVADPNLDAKLPAIGTQAAVASLSVTAATEDAAKMPASLGSKADAASLPVTMSTEDKAKIPALGAAASAASSPVVLASDDAQLAARMPNPDMSSAPGRLALTTTSAEYGSQLAVGTYLIRSDAPAYILQGATGLTAIAAGAGESHKIEAGVLYVLPVTNTTTKGYIAGILDAGTGTLQVWATQ